MAAASIGKKPLTIEAGHPGKGKDFVGGFGSTHQSLKHGVGTSQQVDPRKVARAIVTGEKSKIPSEEKGVAKLNSQHKGTLSSLADKGDHLRFITAFDKHKAK